MALTLEYDDRGPIKGRLFSADHTLRRKAHEHTYNAIHKIRPCECGMSICNDSNEAKRQGRN
jgi:hypothetical protein